jgi:hypothetical protein
MKLDNLTSEEKKQLKEYIHSLKEIKKCISELLEKANVKTNDLDEVGGNMSKGLTLHVAEN